MAITAIGFRLYELLQHQNDMAKAQQTINDSTQTWADILGFTNKQLKLDANNLDSMVSSSQALARCCLQDASGFEGRLRGTWKDG
jgi:hypothetical protein